MTTPDYEPMAAILQPGVLGQAKVEHFTVGDPDLRMMLRPAEYVPKGTYARLYVGKTLMMSDTSMEKRSNYGFVRAATGDVLVAGLGLGLILVPILRKPEVTSVTVIEKYQDVVDLVLPALLAKVPEAATKLKVVVADAMEHKPAKGETWDVIYFDIWPDICEDNLDDMAVLHKRYARRKRKGGWMDSWQRDNLLYHRRRNARNRW